MSSQTRRAGIALGSNMEPRLGHLQSAVKGLRNLHYEADRRFILSPVYETQPEDCPPGTAAFLNAVAELSTPLDAETLLTELQALEVQGGRPNCRPKNSPRTIDLDLLYLGNEVRQGETLVLPHPRISQRAFVLAPLFQVAPDLILPGQSRTISQLTRECDLAGVTRRWDCPL